MFSAPIFVTFGAVLLALGGQADLNAESDSQTIVGGGDVDPCAWPSAARASVGSTSLAAVLVHPRVVVLTGGLEKLFPTVESYLFSFGYAAGGFPPNPGLYVNTSATNCHFDGPFGVCTLERPVDLPYAPPLFGCETLGVEVGTEVTIVGFGDIGTEPNRTKRAASVTVNALHNTGIIDFDGEAGPCAGDEGSPAFLRMADGSWRTLGIASGASCGGLATYLTLADRVPWIEDVTGIDVSPCHDADGFPEPGPDCQGFFAGDADDFGTWIGLECRDGPLGGDAGVCSSDASPPSVAIESPGADASYSDAPATVMVHAVADDGVGLGVRDVRLSINGEVLPNERTVAPYEFDVELPEGSWMLTAIARDWGGNESESDEVTVVIGDPPTPAPGTSTGGSDETGGSTGDTGEPMAEPAEEEGTESGGSPAEGSETDGNGGCSTHPTQGRGWLALVVIGFLRRRRSRSTEHGAR